MSAGAALLLTMLIATEAPRLARLALFVPALAAAILLLQVRERTCIALAARGFQHLDDGGLAPVRDTVDLAAMQQQARRVRRGGLLIALALTVISLLIA